MPEVLGRVIVPTGKLLLIDFGLLYMWSHDRKPELPPEIDAKSVGEVVDIQIDGPDALEAAHLHDWVGLSDGGAPSALNTERFVLKKSGEDSGRVIFPL